MKYFNLKAYITTQLDTFFPVNGVETELNDDIFSVAISRTEHCFSNVIGYTQPKIDHFHSGQYATLLYYLANSIWAADGELETATRIFLLNKMLNGIDLYYEVEMPPVFLIGHTVGMVFSKATYGNFCLFHQGCTVGRNFMDRPTLKENVVLFPNSSVIGRCIIGSNVVISPGVQVINQDIPDNCMVFNGKGNRLTFKDLDSIFVEKYFNINSKNYNGS